MSQAPGLDLLTPSVPGDATNGVTIDAAATGEPERSWIVIDHPFRSFISCSFSARNDVLKQPVLVFGSDMDDLYEEHFLIRYQLNNLLTRDAMYLINTTSLDMTIHSDNHYSENKHRASKFIAQLYYFKNQLNQIT